MTTMKSRKGHRSLNDANFLRALEILSASAGDVPMETEARPATLKQCSIELSIELSDDTDPAGDIPLAPGTISPPIPTFAECPDLNQEISNLFYRRSVVSEWPESSRKAAFLAGIDNRSSHLLLWAFAHQSNQD